MESGEEETDEFITQTQTQSVLGVRTSRLEYWWLILFEWNVEVDEPFQIFVKSAIKSGVPETWFQGALTITVVL